MTERAAPSEAEATKPQRYFHNSYHGIFTVDKEVGVEEDNWLVQVASVHDFDHADHGGDALFGPKAIALRDRIVALLNADVLPLPSEAEALVERAEACAKRLDYGDSELERASVRTLREAASLIERQAKRLDLAMRVVEAGQRAVDWFIQVHSEKKIDHACTGWSENGPREKWCAHLDVLNELRAALDAGTTPE